MLAFFQEHHNRPPTIYRRRRSSGTPDRAALIFSDNFRLFDFCRRASRKHRRKFLIHDFSILPADFFSGFFCFLNFDFWLFTAPEIYHGIRNGKIENFSRLFSVKSILQLWFFPPGSCRRKSPTNYPPKIRNRKRYFVTIQRWTDTLDKNIICMLVSTN